MPFRSKAQQRFMFARHPQIARRWVKKYGVPGDLPEKVQSKRKKVGRVSNILRRRRRRTRYALTKK